MSILRCGALRFAGSLTVNPAFRQKLSFLSTGPNLFTVQIKQIADKNDLLQIVNQQHQHQRGHRNLGHRPVPDSLHTKLWMCFLAAMVVGTQLDWKWYEVSFYLSEYVLSQSFGSCIGLSLQSRKNFRKWMPMQVSMVMMQIAMMQVSMDKRPTQKLARKDNKRRSLRRRRLDLEIERYEKGCRNVMILQYNLINYGFTIVTILYFSMPTFILLLFLYLTVVFNNLWGVGRGSIRLVKSTLIMPSFIFHFRGSSTIFTHKKILTE